MKTSTLLVASTLAVAAVIGNSTGAIGAGSGAPRADVLLVRASPAVSPCVAAVVAAMAAATGRRATRRNRRDRASRAPRAGPTSSWPSSRS